MSSPVRQFGIEFARVAAWLAIAWERLWPLVVPVILVAIVFFSLSWLGIWNNLSVPVHIAILIIIFLAALVSLLPLRHFQIPDRDIVTRRIEIESHLSDRPIAAQTDEIALGHHDEYSQVLWAEHRDRMRVRLQNLTGGAPRASGGRFDPYGLRLAIPLTAFVAFMVSFAPQGGRISDALRLGGDPAKLLRRLDIWVNPPTYTGKPPVYLAVDAAHQQARSILLPQNSRLVGRFIGEGNLSLSFVDEQGETMIDAKADNGINHKAGQSAQNFEHNLETSGIVRVRSQNTTIAQWSVKIIADTPPQIVFEEDPQSSLSGTLQFSYRVKDDYGVKSATAVIEPLHGSSARPKTPASQYSNSRFAPLPDARGLFGPLNLALPLPRVRAKSGVLKTSRDVAKHPLAGSLVRMKLAAEDDPGLKGQSKWKTFVLPGRNFINPVARALVEQRRILALDANRKDLVAHMLDALATAPEKFIDDYGTFLAIRIAWRRLVDARNDDALRSVTDLMWDIALGIEFGKMSSAQRRLREAQERLDDALENGASDKEIEKLMNELRQAMNELIKALEEQAKQVPGLEDLMAEGDMVASRQQDLKQMIDRIEDLAKSGSKEAARQLLDELQRMMDNLQAGRHMQQRQIEGDAINKAFNKFSDLLQKQQELMDETYRMQQQQPRNRPVRPDQDDENQQMSEEEYNKKMEQLRSRQQALEQQLKSLDQQLKELGLNPSDQFDEAGEQMSEAGDRLGQGRAGDAVGNQGRALDALRRGAQAMMKQMAGDRMRGGLRPGEGDPTKNSRLGRDPLGRDQQNLGNSLGRETKIPGEIDAQRARQILEAIRDRLSLPKSPLMEKDYLERLLQSR